MSKEPVRLPFTVIRKIIMTEKAYGEIEVNDPSNEEEIAAKLKAKDFIRLQPLAHDYIKDEWTYEAKAS